MASILGIVSGIGLLAYAIGADGGLGAFWNLPSVMITFGGTLAATVINYRMSQILGALGVLRNVFWSRHTQPAEVLALMVDYATRARREGLLALDRELPEVRDPFLAKGIQLVVDGTDSELTRSILETDLMALEKRHQSGQGIFEAMGSLSPSFGLVGTLIGLIKMLRTLDDPSTIGPGMSVALLTTFYGALFAFLICIPLAGKLRICHDEEYLVKRMTIEGLLAIQAGNNPRLVDQKLRAHLSPGTQRAIDRRAAGPVERPAGEAREVELG
ncbi:MAG: motility protein A [bacterium]|nr:motility protein A [bacterium]